MESAKGIAELYEHKMNAVLDRDSDESGMVDYSSAQLLDLLAEVCRKEAQIEVDRNHAAMQVSRLDRAATQLLLQAEQAERERREDLARQALTRRAAIRATLPHLMEEETALRENGARLSAAERGMRDKIEKFLEETHIRGSGRTHIRTCITNIFAGIRNEIEDADIAARLAEDDVNDLKSQARALHNRLIPSGNDGAAVSDWPRWDFAEIRAEAIVENELAEIRDRADKRGGNGSLRGSPA